MGWGLGLKDPRALLLAHHLNDIRAAMWSPDTSPNHNAYAVPIQHIIAHPTDDNNYWTMRNIMKEIAYYGYTIHWPRKSSANWPPGQSPFEADERLLLQASIHKSIDRIKPNPRIVYRVTNQKETALNRAGGSGRWHFREPQHRLTEHQRINPQEHLLKSIEDGSGKHVSPYGHFTIDPANIPTLAHGFGKPEAGPEVIAIDLEKVEAEFYNSMDPDQVAK